MKRTTTRTSLFHCSLSLFCVLASTACFRPRFPGSEKVFGNDDLRPGADRQRTSTAGLLLKRVSEKQEPATLLSADGYRCTVNPSRFEDAKVGESVWCAWQKQ